MSFVKHFSNNKIRKKKKTKPSNHPSVSEKVENVDFGKAIFRKAFKKHNYLTKQN